MDVACLEEHLAHIGELQWTEEIIDLLSKRHLVKQSDVIIHLIRALIMLLDSEQRDKYCETVRRFYFFFCNCEII
jgi:hypothetical protein